MRIIRNEELLYAEQKFQLQVSEISYGFLDSKWKHKNLRAAFTRIYIPLAGEGEITVDGTTIPLTVGNIYVIPAGLSFSCDCPQYMEKIYVHLVLTQPDGSDLFWGIHSCIVLPDQGNWANQAKELYEANDLISALHFKLLLHQIVCEALSCTPPHTNELPSYSPHTKAALHYIGKHLSASLTIQEIAAALFISKNLLQKQFKEDLKKPIGQYIDERIMARAEQYLLADQLSIKDISEMLGFCDQFYFSRKFNQAHGISPLRFRHIHRITSVKST